MEASADETEASNRKIWSLQLSGLVAWGNEGRPWLTMQIHGAQLSREEALTELLAESQIYVGRLWSGGSVAL